MKRIEILLKPSYNSSILEFGYGENDDYDENAVSHQQGYNTKILVINPGQEFSIDENYESGYLENEEYIYIN